MRRSKVILTIIMFLLIIAGGGVLFAMTDTGSPKTGDQTAPDTAPAAGITERSSSPEAGEGTDPSRIPENTSAAEAFPAQDVVGRNEHVFAHRGASGEEVEHTIKAYDLAIRQGADHIEQDVVLSKEGTLYVSHDDSAGRITGVNRNFADMTDAEIDERTTSDGQHILRLSQVFERYGQLVVYVIELKDQGEATTRLIELVKQYNMSGNVIIQCSKLEALEKVKAAFPNVPTLYLTDGQGDFTQALELSYVDILSVNKKNMSEEDCRRAHEKQKQYNIWTLNEEGEIRQAIEMGADSYFTDYPGRAIELEGLFRK